MSHYTAEEIRDAILKLKVFQEDKKTLLRIEDMLNQAADMMERENKCLKNMLRPIVKADRNSCDCASEWSALCRRLVDEVQSEWSRLGNKMINEGKDMYTLEDE